MPSDNKLASAAAVAWRWWVLAISVATADQLTKLAVSTLMYYGQSIPLTGFFNLVHVWNTGAAFSVLADAGGWQRYFFILITLGVSIALVFMLRSPRPRIEALGYSLILGGALGNGFDRVVRGYVIDFLDFYWRNRHWPAFNLADCGIVLGVACLFWATWNTAVERQTTES